VLSVGLLVPGNLTRFRSLTSCLASSLFIVTESVSVVIVCSKGEEIAPGYGPWQRQKEHMSPPGILGLSMILRQNKVMAVDQPAKIGLWQSG
jgi:hypothetical protein